MTAKLIRFLIEAHPYHPVFTIPGVIIMVLLVSACAHGPREQPDTRSPVCEALIGPITYNSKKKDSRRFAGPDLAPDLAKRNRVGVNLRCPLYRNPPRR